MEALKQCPRCGKRFKWASDLERHLSAKRKCVPLFAEASVGTQQPEAAGEFTCKFCGRCFTAATNRNRHIRNSCKIAPTSKNGDGGMERLYEHTLQRQVNRLESQMAEMLQLLRDQQHGSSAASSSTLQAGEIALQGDHARVDNSKKIVINVFGQEKLDHITAERIKTILDECLQRPALPAAVNEAVLKTAMLVYSDPDRPENLTAYLPNKKTKGALVHTKAGWEVQPTQLVLPPMALKSIDAIFGKQPPEDEYAPLLKELQQNEARYVAGEDLHPILVRNKDLLARVLATLPVAGQ